ncbi:magnesium transporter CorA family protein [Fictibacillus nanhaiensis]|uniref:magnesium transporter CorA family protein n=1 Tax=Fictibacillus nanhaiensis TaxID=742169 RepID=UPI001C941E5F|nr:magnesium transporter CorA family protein [Fictibacillus nanhaiensis]MBY6036442.1 magnesium transporter CorA family protein [Fictibacillus nanhaiensis]
MLKYKKSTNKTVRIENFEVPDEDETLWIFYHSPEEMKKDAILDKIELHHLAIAAFSTFSEHPKINVYANHAVVSTFYLETDSLEPIRINLLIGTQYLIVLAEHPTPFREQLVKDFKENPEHMQHVSYMLYYFMKDIVDSYLEVVDQLSNEFLELEKSVFVDPLKREIGHKVYRWKSRLHKLRQYVEAEEIVIQKMGHDDFEYANEESGFYFKDLLSSFSRVTTAFDSFKENLKGILDLQMSLKSDHMNRIMKTLTLVSAVFVPLTFIAGLYGMNFEVIPELKWQYGYFYVLSLCFALAVIIMGYFKKKRWW